MAVKEYEYRQKMNEIIERDCIPSIPLGRIAVSVKLHDTYGTFKDLLEATDMVAVVRIASANGWTDLNISKRVRDISAYKFSDITLRAARESGMPTELRKIREGQADF